MGRGAFIFDMDGVIVDTEPLHIRAWEVLFERHQLRAGRNYFDRFVGVSDLDSVRIINAQLNVNLPAKETTAERLDIFAQLVVEQGVTPTPGFIETYRLLRERRIPIGVATSSTRHAAQVVLDSIAKRLVHIRNGAQGFDVIVAREDVRAVKPDPECYLLASSRLKRKPGDCVAMEDSPSGVQAAVSAGLRCIALASRYFDAASLSAAHQVVTSFEQLIASGVLTALAEA